MLYLHGCISQTCCTTIHPTTCMCVCARAHSLSCVQLFVIPWTVAHQALLSMGFSRQEYWSGLPFPPPGELPNPRIEPKSPSLQADSLLSQPTVLVAQSCPILCDPMDCSPPGSSVHGILQTRILEWVAISFSRREDCLLVSRLLYVRRQND